MVPVELARRGYGGVTLHVLLVTNMWPTEEDPGFGVFVHQQVEALRRLGVDFDVLLIHGRRGRQVYARAVRDVRDRLRSGHYDLIHAHYVLSGLACVMARPGVPSPPLLVTHHGVEVFDGWQAPLSAFVTARADETIVVSAAMAERLGLGPESVIPMGVDLEGFAPGSRAEARAALGLGGSDELVAWVGAERPEKRLDLARAAVNVLQVRRPDVRLHQVTGRPHSEVPLHMRAADCLLLTSSREGAPVVVKEALACDLPVVSTDVGDVAEITAEVEGCAIAAPTPEALAAALDAALEHGRVAGRAVVERYGVDRMAERVLAAYERVAER